MFKSSKTKSTSEYQESIGSNTQITGDISSNNNFRLDGMLTGALTTTAKVVIGKKARIDGALSCESARISGVVKGELTITGQLIVKSTARIEGTVVAASLIVEDGGRMEATCTIKKQEDRTISLPELNKENKTA
ncbi:MAG: polymer-forming cytoskeletal protein [Nonlabens sp.]